MEGVAYYVIVSYTSIADVFMNGAALLLIQQVDNMIGNIAKLMLKPYGKFLAIEEQNENLAKLYCVYTSIHTLSQCVLLFGFAIAAYWWEPTHKNLLYMWQPYAIFLVCWVISIQLIDSVTACLYTDGKQMFDRMLSGFTPRLDATFDNFVERGDDKNYTKQNF